VLRRDDDRARHATATGTSYVEQILVPELKPGDIVIMDNLSSHKGKAIASLIKCTTRQECRNYFAAAGYDAL
jgi:hypothetical protein